MRTATGWAQVEGSAGVWRLTCEIAVRLEITAAGARHLRPFALDGSLRSRLRRHHQPPPPDGVTRSSSAQLVGTSARSTSTFALATERRSASIRRVVEANANGQRTTITGVSIGDVGAYRAKTGSEDSRGVEGLRMGGLVARTERSHFISDRPRRRWDYRARERKE